ncbi:MAG: MFS transporter [Frankiaceae bacterium]
MNSSAPGSAARSAVRRLRGAARADGAGETGLASLIEVHAMSSAGDALVVVALAGSLFFGVPIGEARSRVLLYLVITMAPFALLAPVVGPLLDRVRRGRRLAIAATLVGRGILALSLARALSRAEPLELYPTAFGLLLASKAYGVSRSSVVPRLLPPGASLVRVNSRLTLAGLLLATLAAPVGGGLSVLTSSAWTLRLAAMFFFIGAALTFGFPQSVDDTETLPREPAPPGRRGRRRLLVSAEELGSRVPIALAAAGLLRGLNGFLTIFLAFLLRDRGGLGSVTSTNTAIGAVIAAAAIGGLLGTAAGGRIQRRTPLALSVLTTAVAAVACLAGAIFYGLIAMLAVGLLVGIGQAISKLALDSLVQRDVGEHVRNSAFSLSESGLQLAWVLGGIVGIVLPLNPTLGFGVAAVAAVGVLAYCLAGTRRSHLAGSPRLAG